MLESENQPLGTFEVKKNYVIRFYQTRSETSLILTRTKSTQTEKLEEESSSVLSKMLKWCKDSVAYIVSSVSEMVVGILLFIMESLFYISGDDLASTLFNTLAWGLRSLTRLIYTVLDKRLEVLLCLVLAAAAYSLAAPQIHQILHLAAYVLEYASNVLTIPLFGKPRPQFKLRIVHSGNFKKIGK